MLLFLKFAFSHRSRQGEQSLAERFSDCRAFVFFLDFVSFEQKVLKNTLLTHVIKLPKITKPQAQSISAVYLSSQTSKTRDMTTSSLRTSSNTRGKEAKNQLS